MQIAFAAALPRAIMPAAIRHSCAQSMSSAIHLAIIFTSSSCRHALAHWSHAFAHMLHASMQAVMEGREVVIISFSLYGWE